MTLARSIATTAAKATFIFGSVFSATAFSQQPATGAIRNVVLVHGAWADGSSWSKIIPLLEAKGLHVVCVQNPLTSFADDVAATNRAIDAQDGPVLLVGHSYGGAVITEAGNKEKVAGLVYVAAFAPDKGESAGSQSKPYGPTPGIAELRPLEDGFLVLTPKGIAEDFAPDLSPTEHSILTATQTPTQGSALGSPITEPAWRTKPTWFIVAANDRMISPKQETDSAKKMGARTLTLQSSHVPMLSKPSEVAAFIIEAAHAQKVGH
ncbi:pimeloyl-ACP methyl ester carboxylesterase [Granulicella aggregans]|uniref:Pimeloyl-ACP methyl ester carboxylesterase n=1 Tax=Granulicella aggregans TaxID=474949 RepID=A0A7W7ZHZ3_9BACT|nr:alpha/beta hydrolase [Granulicella aggregans]MBB5059591.1 pimeloyl-ACP methyl ester carboxylesterase [Granulicella aggregans]